MADKGTGNKKTRFVVQYDDHPKFVATEICSLLEHQSLVDVAIRCGNQTLHAHKVILAANSPYFREKFENQPDTEQIIINGMDFSTLKSVLEFVYCGETSVLEENLKYVVSAGKLFQIRGLQAIGSESPAGAETVYYPPPIFINQKAKYSSGNEPYTQTSQKSQSKNKVDNLVDYVAEVDPPLQVLNFEDLNASLIPPENSTLPLNVFDMSQYQGEKPIEIIYKTPDGEYLNVANEVPGNFAENSMQFQAADPVVSGQMADGSMPSSYQIEDESLEQLLQSGTADEAPIILEQELDEFYGMLQFHSRQSDEISGDPSLAPVVDVNAADDVNGQNKDEHAATIVADKNMPLVDDFDMQQLDQILGIGDANQEPLFEPMRSMPLIFDNDPFMIQDEYGHQDDSEVIDITDND